jgi:rare lipoprotein A
MKQQKIWSGMTVILVATLLGTTGSTTLSSKAIASNSNTDEIAKTRSIITDEQNSSIATIYTYQIGNSTAATLYVRNIPILTFLEKPEDATTSSLDPSFQAQQVADKINQLTESQRENSQITVSWEPKTQSFLIHTNEQILTKINDRVTLADSTKNSAEDALQATNRLRRLLSYAPPVTEIIGLPKPEPKPEVQLVSNTKPVNAANKNSVARTIRGMASWYGPGFHGRRTASGQVFNQNALTAAHRSLPFGTRVRVTNLRNGRSTVVRINDRGPYSGGRIIDLSAAAARAIGMHNSGVANVKVEILGR